MEPEAVPSPAPVRQSFVPTHRTRTSLADQIIHLALDEPRLPRQCSGDGSATYAVANRFTRRQIQKLATEIGRAVWSDRCRITLQLDSDGGDFAAAVALADFLKSLPSGTTLRTAVAGRAICESSCTVIFAVGQERVASPMATFMFHPPRIVRDGDFDYDKVQLLKDLISAANRHLNTADPQMEAIFAKLGVMQPGGRRAVNVKGKTLKAHTNFITALTAEP